MSFVWLVRSFTDPTQDPTYNSSMFVCGLLSHLHLFSSEPQIISDPISCGLCHMLFILHDNPGIGRIFSSFCQPRYPISMIVTGLGRHERYRYSKSLQSTFYPLTAVYSLHFAVSVVHSLRFCRRPRSPRASSETNQSTFSKGIPLRYPADQL